MPRKVVMLQETKGSPDGIAVNTYEKDKEYVVDSPEMPLALAKIFVEEMKVAKAIKTLDVNDDVEESPTNPQGRVGPTEKK